MDCVIKYFIALSYAITHTLRERDFYKHEVVLHVKTPHLYNIILIYIKLIFTSFLCYSYF